MHPRKSIKYSRGFLITEKNDPQEAPEHWKKEKFGKLLFHYDPNTPITSKSGSHGRQVIFFGDVFDVRNPAETSSEIASRIVNSIDTSSGSLNRVHYFLAGRYILLYKSSESYELRGDAANTKAIFFNPEISFLAASHARLIAETLCSKTIDLSFKRAPEFQKGSKYLPGFITPYEGIRFLTPNTALNLNEGTTERFFPSTPAKRQPLSTACEAAAVAMENILKATTSLNNRKIVQSLTAGMDSRVSLAVSRRFSGQIEYFTYMRENQKSQVKDALVAKEMSEKLQLKHTVLDRDRMEANICEADLTEIRKNTFLGNGLKLALSYRDVFPSNTTHIRSNLGEIVRSVYPKIHNGIESLTPAKMAKVWKNGLEGNDFVVNCFDQFFRKPILKIYKTTTVWICFTGSIEWAHGTAWPYSNRMFLFKQSAASTPTI